MQKKTDPLQEADLVPNQDNFITPAAYSMFSAQTLMSSPLEGKLQPLESCTDIMHLHASRPGPLLANEIYLAIQEKARNPELQRIHGLLHPYHLVSKFLDYWLCGLSKETTLKILNSIELNEEKLVRDGKFDHVLLNSLASEVYLTWEHAVKSLFVPIYEEYNTELTQNGFSKKNYAELCEKHQGKRISLEEALIELSLYVVNSLLEKSNLPSIVIDRISPEYLEILDKKYLSRSKQQSMADDMMSKVERRYQHGYDEMLKQLKTYNGRLPDIKTIEKIYQNNKRKIGTACSKTTVSFELLMRIVQGMDSTQAVEVPVGEYIIASIEAYRKSAALTPYGADSVIFLDGKSMIEACFLAARETKSTLVLQEFMREFDYDIYFDLMKKYSDLKVANSSCRIWDVRLFPEFDFNFVRGLRYLASYKYSHVRGNISVAGNIVSKGV